MPSPDTADDRGRLNIPAASCHFQLIRNYHLFTRIEDETKSEAIKLAELMGPNIPVNLCLTQAKAQGQFKNIVVNTLYDLPGVTGVTAASRKLPSFWTLTQEAYDQIGATEDFHGRNLTRKSLPLQFPAPYAELVTLTHEQLGQLWYVMCSYITEAYGVQWIREQLLNLVVHILVGTVKQGNCTPDFARKINNGMMQDFGQEVNLMPEVIAMWYQRCSSGIDDTNIRVILGRWLSMIPDEGMRLTLTIVQAPGTGLTTFITIGKAMRSFPLFPWETIQHQYPSDWINFEQALDAVKNNPWYGYRKDIGFAKASGLKNLAWVAKELLIQGAGDDALRRYKGWIRRPPQSEKMTYLIRKFLGSPVDIDADQEWQNIIMPQHTQLDEWITEVLTSPDTIYK